MVKSTVFTALGDTKESQHDPFDATYAMIEPRQHTIGRTDQMVRLDDIGNPQDVLSEGWPTIWMPITVSLREDDHPEAIGKRLEIGFGNTGEPASVAVFDAVRLEMTDATPRE